MEMKALEEAPLELHEDAALITLWRQKQVVRVCQKQFYTVLFSGTIAMDLSALAGYIFDAKEWCRNKGTD